MSGQARSNQSAFDGDGQQVGEPCDGRAVIAGMIYSHPHSANANCYCDDEYASLRRVTCPSRTLMAVASSSPFSLPLVHSLLTYAKPCTQHLFCEFPCHSAPTHASPGTENCRKPNNPMSCPTFALNNQRKSEELFTFCSPPKKRHSHTFFSQKVTLHFLIRKKEFPKWKECPKMDRLGARAKPHDTRTHEFSMAASS